MSRGLSGRPGSAAIIFWLAISVVSGLLLGWGWMTVSCLGALTQLNLARLRGEQGAPRRIGAASVLFALLGLAGLIRAIETTA